METDRPWIIVRVDGKISAISNDYSLFAQIASGMAKTPANRNKAQYAEINEVLCTKTGFEEVWQLSRTLKWDDMRLFGTPFQKKVWKKLFELTHGPDILPDADTKASAACVQQGRPKPRLISYSDFAELCENRPGVRAVAHAIGLNPVSVVIPCHLVIPKESADKINEIKKMAEVTLFKGDDLCFPSDIDFGNYALGPSLKRELIALELTGRQTSHCPLTSH